MDGNKNKKHFFYYLNHKNLIGEIEQYGYVVTLKKVMLAYLGMILGSIAAAFMFRLKPIGYTVVIITSIVLTPFIMLYSYRTMFEQRRFSDASKYIEKMLYYFKASGRILDSLRNALEVFHDGLMKTTIQQAINCIETENIKDVNRTALKIIEKEYPNSSIRRLHQFLFSVEKNGGDPSLGIDMLLLDRERWTSEVVMMQKAKKRIKKQFSIFSVLVILLCLTILYIPMAYKTFNFDLSSYSMVRAASVALIVITLLIYTKLSKMIGKSWMEEDELKSDEELEKEFLAITEYNEGKEKTKSIIYAAITVLITGVIYLFTTSLIILVLGIAIAAFLFMSYKIGYKLGKKKMIKEIEKAFPEWILQVALLLQFNNVPMSLEKSYENAPGILKPEIRKMLLDMDDKPTSPVPYNNFMEFFNLPDINEAMSALYSITNAAGADVEKELRTILSQDNKMAEKQAAIRQEDKEAANEIYIYLEVIFGCLLLLVDTFYMILSFMNITTNMI